MMKRTLHIGFFFFIWIFPLYILGQTACVTGRVTSLEGGNPLTGAHVLIQPGNKLTSTDFEGQFRICGLSPGDHRIAVSFIGYATITRNITLHENDNLALDFPLEALPLVTEVAVITGNKVVVSKNTNPMTLSLVTRDELDQSGESNVLPVISNRIPGVFVTERGITGFGVGDGSAGRISIRGISGTPNTQVLVMIDGHPQFTGIFGHPLPDAYIASDVEKVEVVRGPASILYGSNAMAGVVNMITRQQEHNGWTLIARAQYGSYNTQKYSGSVGYKNKGFHVLGSVNHDQAEGHRENSDFDITNGYFKAGYEINPHFRLLINASLASYHSTDPGPVYSDDTTYQNGGHWGDFLRGEGALTLENHFPKSEGALKLYVNGGEHKLYDGFHSTDHLAGFAFFQGLRLWPDNLITAGIDYKQYGGFAENTILDPPLKITDTTVYEAAAYVLLHNALTDKLSATAGIRLENNEYFGWEWIPQIGMNWQVSPVTSLKAIVSKGFRSPTIRELFLFRSANPQLEPERIWNYEAGIVQFLLEKQLSFEVNGFVAVGSNMIQTIGVFPDVKNENTGDFLHYGLEFQGKFSVSPAFDLLGSYSWLHTDEPRLAAPAHQLFLEGSYRWQNLHFNLDIAYVNGLVTQATPGILEQSYVLLNVRIGYRLTRFLTAFASGQNLLDQSYEINDGYPMPGINAMAGIVMKFDFQIQ